MRPTQLLAAIASFSALTQAWPWPDSSENNALMINRRQDTASNTASSTSATSTDKTTSATGKSTSGSTAKSQTATKTTASNTASGSGSSASASGSGASDSGNGTTSAPASGHTSFDSRDGVGSIVMVNPGVFSPTTYYKVGQFVTWAWNYTSIQGTPTAVDVWAYCSAAKATYTLTTNMTYDDKGGKFTWDTNQYATSATQLLTNQYTLSIADADIGPSGSSGAGYLDPLPMMTFGMYTPQSYVNFSDFTCPTCNSGAMSLSEKQTWSFLLGMSSITVLSFTWFATGRFGVL